MSGNLTIKTRCWLGAFDRSPKFVNLNKGHEPAIPGPKCLNLNSPDSHRGATGGMGTGAIGGPMQPAVRVTDDKNETIIPTRRGG